jgi:hypothetical protein
MLYQLIQLLVRFSSQNTVPLSSLGGPNIFLSLGLFKLLYSVRRAELGFMRLSNCVCVCVCVFHLISAEILN